MVHTDSIYKAEQCIIVNYTSVNYILFLFI